MAKKKRQGHANMIFFLVFDAILYVDKTGCQWRNLPHDFQAWQTVYYYFRAWSAIGEFKNLLDSLVAEVRFQEGQTPEPSVAVVDFIALTITARVAVLPPHLLPALNILMRFG